MSIFVVLGQRNLLNLTATSIQDVTGSGRFTVNVHEGLVWWINSQGLVLARSSQGLVVLQSMPRCVQDRNRAIWVAGR